MIELENINANSVVVIAGPTASGKSGLAIDLALKYNGEVINADSMQVYKGTPIISAAPTVEDKLKVKHHLFEIYEPSYNGTVSEWLKIATITIKKVQEAGKLPIVVGGTGFYIENLIKGTSPIPETKAEIKAEVNEIFAKKGGDEAYRYLQVIDVEGAKKVKPQDTTRVRRALEIFLDTGKSIAEWFEMPMIQKMPDAEFVPIALVPEMDVLEKRCALRFDKMIEDGAVAEVENLLKLNLNPNLPAMKMLGVPELAEYLRGNINLQEAVELAKLHTRQYAKRQRTWFKNRLAAQIIIKNIYKSEA